MTNNKSAAYQMGLQAAKDGKIPPDNPFKKNTVEYNDWLDGLIDGSI